PVPARDSLVFSYVSAPPRRTGHQVGFQDRAQLGDVQAADGMLLGSADVGGIEGLDLEGPVGQPERPGVVCREYPYLELFLGRYIELGRARGASVGELL